jgi:hypothetical protein
MKPLSCGSKTQTKSHSICHQPARPASWLGSNSNPLYGWNHSWWLKNAEISTDATTMQAILQHVRGKEYLKDQRVEGKMISKRIFKRCNGAGVQWSGSGYGQVKDSCEHGNELLGSIKCGGLPDWLRNCQFVKNYSATWSQSASVQHINDDKRTPFSRRNLTSWQFLSQSRNYAHFM